MYIIDLLIQYETANLASAKNFTCIKSNNKEWPSFVHLLLNFYYLFLGGYVFFTLRLLLAKSKIYASMLVVFLSVWLSVCLYTTGHISKAIVTIFFLQITTIGRTDMKMGKICRGYG